MAQRRMFSPKIVSSDAFLDMPVSARELYFQLGMYADDDGFINPKRVIRMVGASDDDLKILIGKRFVISFEDGIVVIKHWAINNLIRKDWYAPTVYVEHKKKLKLKENSSYTEIVNEPVNSSATQYSLVKYSLDKNTEQPEAASFKPLNEINQVLDIFYKGNNPTLNYANKTFRKDAEFLIGKFGLPDTLAMATFAVKVFEEDYAPSITTPTQLRNKYPLLKKHKDKQR